jgi:hypothetical protein
MKDADLQSLSNAIPVLVNQFENAMTPADRGTSLANLDKLNSIVSNEEKRKFDEQFKSEQYALNKDHTYSVDDLEKKRFNQQIKDNSERNELEKKKFEQSIKDNSEKNEFEKKKFEYQVKTDSKRNKLEKDKLNQQLANDKVRNDLEERKLEQQISNDSTKNDIEKLRLEIEKDKLDMQRMDYAQKAKDSHDEKMFRWISFGVTTGLGLVTTIVPILVYRKLAYTNLKLIYKDEGRPSTEYKDAIKSVQNLIRKK